MIIKKMSIVTCLISGLVGMQSVNAANPPTPLDITIYNYSSNSLTLNPTTPSANNYTCSPTTVSGNGGRANCRLIVTSKGGSGTLYIKGGGSGGVPFLAVCVDSVIQPGSGETWTYSSQAGVPCTTTGLDITPSSSKNQSVTFRITDE